MTPQQAERMLWPISRVDNGTAIVNVRDLDAVRAWLREAAPREGLDAERLARAEYEEDAALYRRQRKPPWAEMVANPGAPHNPAKPYIASNDTTLEMYRNRARRVIARMNKPG